MTMWMNDAIIYANDPLRCQCLIFLNIHEWIWGACLTSVAADSDNELWVLHCFIQMWLVPLILILVYSYITIYAAMYVLWIALLLWTYNYFKSTVTFIRLFQCKFKVHWLLFHKDHVHGTLFHPSWLYTWIWFLVTLL